MRRRAWNQKIQGNVADLMTTGIFILAMAVVMLSFMENMELIQQKTEVGQLARQYILRMETTGCLQGEDCAALIEELERLGVTDIDLEGTTFSEPGYGQTVVLNIRGVLGGRYDFSEKRVSTAKY